RLGDWAPSMLQGDASRLERRAGERDEQNSGYGWENAPPTHICCLRWSATEESISQEESGKQAADQHCTMEDGRARQILHLLAARGSRRGEDVALFHLFYGGQQAAIGDGHGNVVMAVAERSGHAAASCVEIDHGRAGNTREQRDACAQQSHRLLMAVS